MLVTKQSFCICNFYSPLSTPSAMARQAKVIIPSVFHRTNHSCFSLTYLKYLMLLYICSAYMISPDAKQEKTN
jgi:hypothetical protein